MGPRRVPLVPSAACYMCTLQGQRGQQQYLSNNPLAGTLIMIILIMIILVDMSSS